MDPITIIITIGAVLAGLLLLWGILAGVFFTIGTRKVNKFHEDARRDMYARWPRP